MQDRTTASRSSITQGIPTHPSTIFSLPTPLHLPCPMPPRHRRRLCLYGIDEGDLQGCDRACESERSRDCRVLPGRKCRGTSWGEAERFSATTTIARPLHMLVTEALEGRLAGWKWGLPLSSVPKVWDRVRQLRSLRVISVALSPIPFVFFAVRRGYTQKGASMRL